MKKVKLLTVVAALGTGFSGLLHSCVDHDYDLSEDMDLVVGVGGGQLTIPNSSTKEYPLSKVLDLDEGSSIRPDGALYGLSEGDYVLVQGGDPTRSEVKIDAVIINGLQGNSASTLIDVPKIPSSGLPTGVNSLDIVIGGQPDASKWWVIAIDPIVNSVDISEDNITPDLVSLQSIGCDINMQFELKPSVTGIQTGALVLRKDFTVVFDKNYTLELTTPESREFCTVVDGHKLIFTADRSVPNNSTLLLPVKISKVDFSNLPAGQGLDENHRFRLSSSVTTTGTMSVVSNDVKGDADISVGLLTATRFYSNSASITEATGIVNPKININDNDFTINDIPDFLAEDGNNLDVYNPQIYLSVTNSSPASVEFSTVLRSYIDGEVSAEVPVGNDVDPIVIEPGNNLICVSRTGESNRPGVTKNVVVAEIGSLIASIPDKIEVTRTVAKVCNRPYTFRLGNTYQFNIETEAVAPLAFGPDLRFTYTDEEDNWDEDFEKYNFNQVVLKATVLNTIPMSLKPNARLLFDGYTEDVKVDVDVDGMIEAGTLMEPKESSFTVTFTSSVPNLAGLIGIAYVFDSFNPEVGIPLNENQSIKFTNIGLTLKGGITVDLND